MVNNYLGTDNAAPCQKKPREEHKLIAPRKSREATLIRPKQNLVSPVRLLTVSISSGVFFSGD
jgi:hypothetical protein